MHSFYIVFEGLAVYYERKSKEIRKMTWYFALIIILGLSLIALSIAMFVYGINVDTINCDIEYIVSYDVISDNEIVYKHNTDNYVTYDSGDYFDKCAMLKIQILEVDGDSLIICGNFSRYSNALDEYNSEYEQLRFMLIGLESNSGFVNLITISESPYGGYSRLYCNVCNCSQRTLIAEEDHGGVMLYPKYVIIRNFNITITKDYQVYVNMEIHCDLDTQVYYPTYPQWNQFSASYDLSGDSVYCSIIDDLFTNGGYLLIGESNTKHRCYPYSAGSTDSDSYIDFSTSKTVEDDNFNICYVKIINAVLEEVTTTTTSTTSSNNGDNVVVIDYSSLQYQLGVMFFTVILIAILITAFEYGYLYALCVIALASYCRLMHYSFLIIVMIITVGLIFLKRGLGE